MPHLPSHTRRWFATIALTGAVLVMCCAGSASATTATTGEILTGNLFLGTPKVEIGARPNGSFGSDVPPPAGYHPRDDHSPELLGFRGNPNSCDWTAPSCITQGDFFVPQAPFEQWGIQVGTGTFHRNDETFSDIAGSFTSADATNPSGVWQSSAPTEGLAIKMTYSAPNYSWLVDAKIELTNTTANPIFDVYYARSVDPDSCVMETRPICTNDSGALVAGTTDTLPTVVSNGPSTGTALVTATQTNDTYLGLRMASPTAKAYRHAPNQWGSMTSPEATWNGTSNQTTTAVGAAGPDSHTSSGYLDSQIGIIDKIDTIEPGETKTIQLQYVLKEGAPTSDPQLTPTTPTATPPATTTPPAAKTHALAFASITDAGTAQVVRIHVPGAGRLTLSGTRKAGGTTVNACTRVFRRVTKAGVVTLRCTLSTATQAARHNGPVTIRLSSTYRPASGKVQRIVRTIRLSAIGTVEPVTG